MPIGSYRIVEYDPRWPEWAREECRTVAAALDLSTGHVEHVGSTAVPGLGAKPIIDLMAGIAVAPSSDAGRAIQDRLRTMGYEIKGIETAPGTIYCRKADPRRFNLHLTEYGKEFWIEHLRFRDWLRSHPDDAAAYDRVKREILAGMGDDPSQPAYNAAKAPFIAAIMAKAVR